MNEEHQKLIFRQINEGAMKIAYQTLNALFLLNGAAATALLATGHPRVKAAAIILALGAFTAIVAHGFTYFSTLAVGDSWREAPAYDGGNLTGRYLIYCAKNYENAYKVPVSLGLVSGTLFLIAIIVFALNFG